MLTRDQTADFLGITVDHVSLLRIWCPSFPAAHHVKKTTCYDDGALMRWALRHDVKKELTKAMKLKAREYRQEQFTPSQTCLYKDIDKKLKPYIDMILQCQIAPWRRLENKERYRIKLKMERLEVSQDLFRRMSV